MDDVALYTVYYSSYQVRNAEAQLPSSVSRKRQGAVCACLVFGAACGLSTVAVGIFVHNPAITWPVVAVGLVGVVVGIILAHQQATGGWCHRLPSTRQPGQNGNVSEQQQPADANRCNCRPPLYNTPIYCAEALDLDTDLVAGAKCTDGFGRAYTAEWGVDEGEDSDEGPSKHPRPQPQAPLLPFAESEAQDAATAAAAAAAAMGTAGSSPAAVAAAVAAGCGIVVCGVPLAGADGIVDTKPVLVLQPNTRLAPYGYDDLQGHVYGKQHGSQTMVEPAPAADAPTATAAATAAAAAVNGAAGDPNTGASEPASPHVAAVVAAVLTNTEGGAGDVLAATESAGGDDQGRPGNQVVWSVSAPTALASASASDPSPSQPLEVAEAAVPVAGLAGDAAPAVSPATQKSVTALPGEAPATTVALPPQLVPAPAPAAASLRRAQE